MRVSIAKPNLAQEDYDKRKVCHAHGYKTVEVESDQHFIELLNTHFVVFGELRDGHRAGDKLTAHAPCFQIDSDDHYAEEIREKLDNAGVKYICVPSGSFDPIERPNKLHFIVFTCKPLSHFRAGYRYQVEEALFRLGIRKEWIDQNAQFDVVRYFAPASIGVLDADTIDEYSDVYGDYEMEVVDAPSEFNNANATAKGLNVQGKAADERPRDVADKGNYWLLPMHGYIYHTQNGWVKYTDVANELKEDTDRIGGFACPVCGSGFDGVTGEQKDWKIPYAFAYKSNNGGNLMFKCTGNHCAQKPLYVADGVYVGLSKLCGSVRREVKFYMHGLIEWDKFNSGLNRIYYNADKKQFICKDNGTFSKMDASDVIFWLHQHKFLNEGGVAEWCDANDKKLKDELKSFYEMVLHQIKIIHQFEELVVKVNPFRDAGLFLENKTLVDRYNVIRIMKPHASKPKNTQAIINDYKKQFPALDDVLKFIAACRFSRSRRKSFMYIRVSAGFGKSFFLNILKDLGVGFETELQKLKPNSASDLSPTDFTNSIVLGLDEFTHFSKEMKKLTHEIVISPKFKMACRVELYGKLMFSAEKSSSFYNSIGVDKQLADRTVVMDFGNIGNLDDREMYRKSSADYSSGVAWYIYDNLKHAIDEYIAMGEIPASNKADGVLRDFKGNVDIKNQELQENLKEALINEMQNLVSLFFRIKSDWWSDKAKQDFRMMQPWKREIIELIGVTASNDVVIRNGGKVFELLLRSLDSHAEKTASYKRGDFVEMLGLKNLTNRRFTTVSGDSANGKCFIFNIERVEEI